MSDMLKPLLAGILASIFMVGCATHPNTLGTAAPFRDSLVVPNKRIGSAVLGMTETQMLDWLGRPDATAGIGDGAYRYSDEGLEIALTEGRVYAVAVTRSGFATADIVSVGTPEREVRVKWGEPVSFHEVGRCLRKNCEELRVEATQYCFGNGMLVEVDAKSHRVTRLQIGPGGCVLP